jgi:hypothetical protein
MEHVGNGLNAPVRMPWEAAQVMIGIVGMKIIEKKEWIEVWRLLEAEGALEVDTSPFEGRPARRYLLNSSNVTHTTVLQIIKFSQIMASPGPIVNSTRVSRAKPELFPFL